MGSPVKTRQRVPSRRRGQLLEHLESRVYLSASATPAAAAPVQVATAATHKYRTDSFTGTSTTTYGQAYVNPGLSDAQAFFNLFHTRYTPYVPPAPSPTPDPTPSPDPTPDPTPDPAPPTVDPAPDAGPSSGDLVTIAQSILGNFTRLSITGTSGNDSIIVSQSGDTLSVTANGVTTSVTGTFGELAIYGASGNDTITVQSSVTITSLVYGGAGNNHLTVQTNAKSFVVALGQGSDVLAGTASTSFWVDPTDSVIGATAKNLHRVSSFLQPFSSTPGSADYVTTAPDGANLRDPSDGGSTVRLEASLWGTGPTMTDVNQGQVGDCYFLADLQSLAYKQAALLQEIAVDLGDGTYGVQFNRNGMTTYVRVDGDLPSAPWGGLYYVHPTSGGAIWASIIEKAYAFYRSGAATFNSLNWGWTGSAFNDLGIASSTFSTGGSNLFNTLTNALAGGKAVAAVTNGSITPGTPIIGSHAYTVVSTSVDSLGTQYVTVRNPWGTDGAGADGNQFDGLVTVTLSQFNASFSSGSIQI